MGNALVETMSMPIGDRDEVFVVFTEAQMQEIAQNLMELHDQCSKDKALVDNIAMTLSKGSTYTGWTLFTT